MKYPPHPEVLVPVNAWLTDLAIKPEALPVTLIPVPLVEMSRAEVHYVVRQGAPQRRALDLTQPAHRELRQPAITAQVGVDGFAGCSPLPVNFFAFRARHTLLPR